VRWIGQQALAGLLFTMPAWGAEQGASIEVSNAWTPALAQTRVDTPIYMTIANRSETPDSLLRVRCPVSNFVEKHVTDRGEGGFAMREVKAIAIPASGTVKLASRGVHLMLLHTTQALQPGETFTCSVVFQKAGTIPIEVTVGPEGAEEKP
jgi:periplasmic copper chaperone A